MTNDTTTIVAAHPAPTPAFRRQALVEHFLEGQEAKTRAEYGRALGRFVGFATAAYELTLPAEQVLEQWFLALPDGGSANEVALRWRAELQKAYAPKTVNQRLSALRSLVRLAKLIGRVNWSLDVKNTPARAYRDTRGTGHGGYKLLLRANGERHGDSPIGRRNKLSGSSPPARSLRTLPASTGPEALVGTGHPPPRVDAVQLVPDHRDGLVVVEP